eukprot:COSAG06_NODE_433_length_15843_cov_10.266768_21_plen_55_part_00
MIPLLQKTNHTKNTFNDTNFHNSTHKELLSQSSPRGSIYLGLSLHLLHLDLGTA